MVEFKTKRQKIEYWIRFFRKHDLRIDPPLIAEKAQSTRQYVHTILNKTIKD